MKRIHLAYAVPFLLLGFASCSNTAPSAPDGGGGTSGGAAGTTGSGGDGAGTAGTTGTAGNGSAGTGEAGTGGTPGSGGSSVAGATGSGGSGGAAGSSGGTAGAAGGAAGATGGSGGSAGGGRGGSGGSAQGGRGGGGTGGSAGSAGGSGGATGTGGTGGSNIVGGWDGALILFPCQDKRTGYDCTNVNCTSGTKTTTQSWQMGGQTGTVYTVTFSVRGVVEAYAYVGGTRVSGTDSISKGTSLFCTGGTQQTPGNGNDYNTYELDVTPGATGAAKDVYYLNSVISSENPHTSTVTQHLTFAINYSAMIKVPGGSTVTFTSYDSNCALVQNCGPTQGSMCQAPRTVSLAGTDPPPPASFMQPYQAPVGSYGQWIYFDVTNVQ